MIYHFRHRVRLGEWNTDSEEDCVTNKGYEDCNDAPVDMQVEEVIPHSDYDDKNINRYNDIALIRLSEDARFTGKFSILITKNIVAPLSVLIGP